ncbi:unnamed protein product, partial [Larinioides sclopetarius]
CINLWKEVFAKRRSVQSLIRYRFGLCSHDYCVCGAKRDPNHYATDCPMTKHFHFTKPSAENLSTWYEKIVNDKRSFVRIMCIMKILHEWLQDIIMDKKKTFLASTCK